MQWITHLAAVFAAGAIGCGASTNARPLGNTPPVATTSGTGEGTGAAASVTSDTAAPAACQTAAVPATQQPWPPSGLEEWELLPSYLPFRAAPWSGGVYVTMSDEPPQPYGSAQYVAKVDRSGRLLWTRSYPLRCGGVFTRIAPLPRDHLAIAVNADCDEPDPALGGMRFGYGGALVELDEEGQFVRGLGAPKMSIFAISAAAGGGLCVATGSIFDERRKLWLFGLDGEVRWTADLPGQVTVVAAARDGGCLAATTPDVTKHWSISWFGSDGRVVWTRPITDMELAVGLSDVASLSDGTVVVLALVRKSFRWGDRVLDRSGSQVLLQLACDGSPLRATWAEGGGNLLAVPGRGVVTYGRAVGTAFDRIDAYTETIEPLWSRTIEARGDCTGYVQYEGAALLGDGSLAVAGFWGRIAGNGGSKWWMDYCANFVRAFEF